MSEEAAKKWEFFFNEVLVITNSWFSLGIFLAASVINPSYFLIPAVLSLIAATVTIFVLKMGQRPSLTRHKWPKHEIWRIVATELGLGTFLTCAFYGIYSSGSRAYPDLLLNYSIFLAIIVAYHKGESIFVMCYHTDEFGWSSYMIYHSREYNIAMGFAQLEFFFGYFISFSCIVFGFRNPDSSIVTKRFRHQR